LMVIQLFYERVYNPEKYLKPGKYRGFKIISLASLVGAYIGWRIGDAKALKEDYEQYVTKFESEDQIYNILQHKKKPVFLYYYVPGDWNSIFFREAFLESAKEHHKKICYMKINCRNHFDVCHNKNIDTSPKIMLHKPVIEKRNGQKVMAGFETYEFRDKDLGPEGVKAFLKEFNIIKKNDPDEGLYNFIDKSVFKPQPPKKDNTPQAQPALAN